MSIIYQDESYEIVGACMDVYNELGSGFLEGVYQEALEMEFVNVGIPYTKEKELDIVYKNKPLRRKYFADFVCFNKIILEIKALNSLTTEHEAQVLNYLKATGYQLGILVNFGEERLKYKRLVR